MGVRRGVWEGVWHFFFLLFQQFVHTPQMSEPNQGVSTKLQPLILGNVEVATVSMRRGGYVSKK